MILPREWCPFPFTEDELVHLLDFGNDELVIEECLSLEELLTFDSLRFELCDEPADEDVLELFEAGNSFKLDELAVNDDELDFTRLLDNELNFEDELLTVDELLLRLLDFSGHQPGWRWVSLSVLDAEISDELKLDSELDEDGIIIDTGPGP